MSMWDDEAGYDYSDPKHPTFAERMFERADLERKRVRENPPADLAEGKSADSDSAPRGEL